MTGITGIVLAAGLSTRMGRPKALLPFRGRTFLQSVIAMLQDAGLSDVIVVLGPDPEAIRAGANPGTARVVVNPRHIEGQLSSIQCGVAVANAREDREEGGPDVRAVVVALVDQPHVPASVPASLVAEFESSRAPIVRPVWQGRGGHPILLSAETFGDLLSLPAGATLYDLVRSYAPRRRDVTAPDDSVLTDIDTPEEFFRLDRSGF